LGINKKKQFVLKSEIKIKNFLKTFLYELNAKIICKMQPIDQKYLQKLQKELQNCVLSFRDIPLLGFIFKYQKCTTKTNYIQVYFFYTITTKLCKTECFGYEFTAE
jgi:hypothetical protein